MRRELSVAITSALLFVAEDAVAFCRTTTVPVAADFDPTPTRCWDEGRPLYHPSQCLPYRLSTRDSPAIPNAILSDKLRRAFAAWTSPNPSCVPGIFVFELAPVSDTPIVGYRPGERGRNIIAVVDDWTHNDPQNTLMLTTITFRPDTGEIFDADMEISSNRPWSTTDVPPSDGYDLDSALTHEAGHFLGFAHVADSNAVMYTSYVPGTSSMRTLTSDEHAAICWVYPNVRERMAETGLVAATACELTQGSAERGCADPEITNGCSTTPARRSGYGGLAAFALGTIALLRRLRRS